MTRKKSPAGRGTAANASKTPPASRKPRGGQQPPAPGPTWDETVINRLLPWRIELLGLLLFVGAFITLLGMTGLIAPKAALVRGWFGLWRQVAGWGAYPLVLSLAALGLHIVVRRAALPYRLRARHVLGGELLLLAALPLSYLLGAGTIATARAGLTGGLLGWGLAQPLLDFLGPLLTTLLYVGLFGFGIALILEVGWIDLLTWLRQLAAYLRRWANRIDAPAPPPPAVPEPAPAAQVPPPRSNLPPAALAASEVVPAEAAAAQGRDPLLPDYGLLLESSTITMGVEEIDRKKAIIEQTLRDFGLVGEVTEVRRGPAVTQFGVTPGYLVRSGPDGEDRQYKVRVNQIANLNRDLALALAVARLRIQAPVPGRGIVGIEVPNAKVAIVRLRALIMAESFQKLQAPLAVCLGLDVSGTPQVANLARMPHLLVAGTTGSGKSVFINALISCLIFNNTPEQLKLVMIDPKKVELIRFNGLPHLLGQVETEHERVIGVLQWIVAEMDRRYQSFAEVGARDLAAYNRLIVRYKDVQQMPHICVFIDELADLMAAYPAEVERALCRLAQMARATGIHLVVATQRPSIDVITGLIKANFPARCSFAVASNTDSRVILDTSGAESLLGKGDMLFLPPEAAAPRRIQGCFVSDSEIEAIVNHWQNVRPLPEKKESPPWERLISRQAVIGSTDDMLERAIDLCQKNDRLSTSLLQRKLRIGFPRAARLMETLFEMGLVEDPKSGGKTRKTYVEEGDEDPLDQFIADNGE